MKRQPFLPDHKDTLTTSMGHWLDQGVQQKALSWQDMYRVAKAFIAWNEWMDDRARQLAVLASAVIRWQHAGLAKAVQKWLSMYRERKQGVLFTIIAMKNWHQEQLANSLKKWLKA